MHQRKIPSSSELLPVVGCGTWRTFDVGRRPYSSWWESDREELDGGYRFHVAYVVRAVTPGSFALPAVNVSDMYAPRVYARSGMGRVAIAPR